MTTQGYAHPEFLVDAAWVEEHLDDPNVVIVDTDLDPAYTRGHIPGAVLVPDNFEKDPDSGRVHIMNPEQFAAMCQGLGIGDDTHVIAYDNSQSLYAAPALVGAELLRAYQRTGAQRRLAALGHRGTAHRVDPRQARLRSDVHTLGE